MWLLERTTRFLSLTSMLLCSSAVALPPVFQGTSLEASISEAKKEDRLVVAYLISSTCDPCRKMDTSTWRDTHVAAWIEKNAIAVQINVDRGHWLMPTNEHTEVPTTVVLKNGLVFDKLKGYRSAEQFRDWFAGLDLGERRVETLRRVIGSQPVNESKVDIPARLRLAEELARFPEPGDKDLAINEYVRLWRQLIHKENSLPRATVKELAESTYVAAFNYRAARTNLKSLRDELAPRAKGDVSRDEQYAWFLLNFVVLSDDATATAWFDRHSGEPEFPEAFSDLEVHFFRLLADRGRWADIGRVLWKPEDSATRLVATVSRKDPGAAMPSTDLDRQMLQNQQRETEDNVTRRLALYHVALLAAGRTDEAWRVIDTGLQSTLNQTFIRKALGELALLGGVVTQRHLDILTQPAATSVPPDLIERVRSKLKPKDEKDNPNTPR